MADRVRTVEERAEEQRDEAEEAEARLSKPPIELGPAVDPAEKPPVADDMPGTELLLPAERRDVLRRTWVEVQSSFIDEPQEAVRQADGLVQELLHSVAEGFESARRELEGEWQSGEGVNTESLRLAFRRYRALFDRLLSF